MADVTLNKFHAGSIKIRLSKALGYEPTVYSDGKTIIVASELGLDKINEFMQVINKVDTSLIIDKIEVKQELGSFSTVEKLKETNEHIRAVAYIKR